MDLKAGSYGKMAATFFGKCEMNSSDLGYLLHASVW